MSLQASGGEKDLSQEEKTWKLLKMKNAREMFIDYGGLKLRE